MEGIKLNDGTEISGGLIADDTIVNDVPTKIYVEIPGTNLVQAMAAFTNSSKTLKLEYYFSVYKYTYNNFTTLVSASVDTDRQLISIYMTGSNVSKTMSYTVPEQYLPESMRTLNQGGNA